MNNLELSFSILSKKSPTPPKQAKAPQHFWQCQAFFFGQNRKTQFPIFITQFRFFGQKTQLFLKNSAKTCKKTQFWVEKLSYFGENSVPNCQNSVFQKNQKRKKREKSVQK